MVTKRGRVADDACSGFIEGPREMSRGANRAVGIFFLILSFPIWSSGSIIYVSNNVFGTIDKVNATGNHWDTFVSVSDPSGVAFDGSGNLYVASFSGNKIMRYT